MYSNVYKHNHEFENKLKIKEKHNDEKQEFVPREIREKPLYELEAVEDIPVSELYQVKVNGKEQRVYHTEFFDFVSFLDENEKAEVEVTVNEPFQKAVIRPAAAQIQFKEEGNKISISLPDGKRITLELDDKLESPLYVLPGKYIPKPENAESSVCDQWFRKNSSGGYRNLS